MLPDEIWSKALVELKMQMTQATFDTWVRPTSAVAFSDGVLTVSVKDGYARDWLDNRLAALVNKTLASIVGTEVRTEFVVSQVAVEDEEDVISTIAAVQARVDKPAELPEFDTQLAGWFKVTRYETLFWAPLLGRVAWRVREITLESDLRRDKSDNWTPPKRYTAPHLADLVPCGKQAIIGVDRRNGDGNLHHHDGAFDRLERFGAGQVSKQGSAPHIIYRVSVQVRLPLLRPNQITHLPARLQIQHDRWLDEHGFDSRDWFVQENAATDVKTPVY